ncbi:MAG TPA: hypothetical protein VIE91_00070 [Methylophilaceae bacterium]|jgi:hypothetical protein
MSKKELLKLFLVMWVINFFVLLVIVFLAELYYPIESWISTDQWRWDTFERSMRFYKACIPASFFIALIIAFNEWLEIKDKAKKADKEDKNKE